MAIGPFLTYVPPGIYTRTLTDNNVTNVTAGLRIPVIVGVGQEELETLDLEIVRGSSSYIDTEIVAEDVTEQWVVDSTNPQNLILGAQTGALTTFRVRNFPLVDGQGIGRVTNDTTSVVVTVNGSAVAVGQVQGAKGLVTLQVPTQPSDIVRCTYWFHRGDTVFTDNVSDQVSVDPATLITPGFEPFNIEAGTSDTLVLTVNGVQATVALLANPATTAASLKSQIDSAAVPGLGTSIFVDNQGRNCLQFSSSISLSIGSGTANGPLGFSAGTSTSRNAAFRVFQRPMVDGSSSGTTTTDTSKVTVKVNGTQVIPASVDGANGLVTLSSPPAPGSTVTVQYWANTWQGTFDYLPNTLVTSVIRCGIAAGRSDYAQGVDFTVANPEADVSVVNWGTSVTVSPSVPTSLANTAFGSSQIVPSLIDQQMYLAECPPVTDTSVIPAVTSTSTFVLPEVPTTGNGRNTALGTVLFDSVANGRIDLPTNRPDLVKVWAGRTLRDALNRAQLTVVAVDGVNRKVTLKSPVPPDWKVYATFYYNNIADDRYLLTCTTPGPVGVGQYTVSSVAQNKALHQVKFGSKSGLAQTVQWPRGVESVPDAFHTGAGTPVSETVTVTFGTTLAGNASYTNKGAGPWALYSASSSWVTKIDGSDVTTNLSAAAPAIVVSDHVTPIQDGGDTGKVTIASGASTLVVRFDGVDYSIPLPTGNVWPSGSAQVVTSSTGASITATANGTATITGLSGMSSTDVGYTLNISGAATSANNGNFIIVEYVSATSVKIRNPDAVAADANNGSIGWTKIVSSVIDTINDYMGTTVAAAYQIGDSTGDWIFTLSSPTTPGALPGGFDSPSAVQIRQGTAEGTLGFPTFRGAVGTSGALAKPATLISTLAGPFAITAGLNDTFKLQVNGIDYSVTLPSGATVATSAIVTAINAISGLSGVASAGTLGNNGKLRLTSPTNDPTSSLTILDGTANAVLGFVSNTQASQALVPVQEVVDVLMADTNFTSGAVAYADTINGNTYITIESLSVGASTSSIGFSSSASSAFNKLTGVGITPGTDGDVGEDSRDMYTVTSSNPDGSSGTGLPGQTYTDAKTGLRFTVLPAATGSYSDAGHFTLLVSSTFDVAPTGLRYSVPGVEMSVSNTVSVAVNDVATVQTYAAHGIEPQVGDFYYISYRYAKQDYSARIFQQLKTIEANFGTTSTTNRATLGAYLAILNGAVLVGVKQVKKELNSNQASAATFNTAIAGLATPLPGNVAPDLIVPLSTDTSVYSYLTNHCEVQSSFRYQAERMGIIGFASGTSPTSAQAIAKALSSNRIVAVYPDSGVITLTDETGRSFDQPVDGTFFAAALAGAVVSPSVDVATPYTRRRLQGFKSLTRVMDPVESNQTAVAGVTILDDLGTLIRVRHGLTTQMDSILTRLPTVTQISDFVQQQSRSTLDSFVGTKFLSSRTHEVEVSMTALLKQLVQAEIIGAFMGVAAAVDPNDPTVLRFNAMYQPIFPLLYLILTFNLRANLNTV